MSLHRRIALAALAIGSMLAAQGCANVVVFGRQVHEAKDSPAEAAKPAAPPDAPTSPTRARAFVVRTVALELDGRVSSKVGANPAFSRDALHDTLTDVLRKRGVLAADGGSATVSIVDFETHPTSNAIVFGYRPGAGTLSATLRVNDASGTEKARFDIEAAALLRARATTGATAFPLEPLYRDLASRVADVLAGTPGRTDDARRDTIPR